MQSHVEKHTYKNWKAKKLESQLTVSCSGWQDNYYNKWQTVYNHIKLKLHVCMVRWFSQFGVFIE